MNHPFDKNSGFTLIELLVVIAIIGLLSSIVLASLATAKLKGQEASIEEEMHQLQIIAEEEYEATGSYAALQPNGWASPTSTGPVGLTCSSRFGSGDAYVAQAITICNSIVANGGNSINWGGGYSDTDLWAGNSISTASKYSFMAYLPSKNVYMCVGSDGTSMSQTLAMWVSGAGLSTPDRWGQPGCNDNP